MGLTAVLPVHRQCHSSQRTLSLYRIAPKVFLSPGREKPLRLEGTLGAR